MRNKNINIVIILMIIGVFVCAESVYALRPPLYYGKRVDIQSRLINAYREMQKTWRGDSEFENYFGRNRPANTFEEVAFVYKLYIFLTNEVPTIGKGYLDMNINISEDGTVYLGNRKNDALTYSFKESLLWFAKMIGLKWDKVISIPVKGAESSGEKIISAFSLIEPKIGSLASMKTVIDNSTAARTCQ